MINDAFLLGETLFDRKIMAMPESGKECGHRPLTPAIKVSR
ncbi:hypothetical protein D083_1603 [Dickeya solani RNS 08.23.3.1.A]|nr:hypothetical protein D083_1603 [Dickeya solani RNS 08.23.3.1.A]